MGRPVPSMLGAGAGVLIACALGVTVAGNSGADMTALMAVCSFATNVFGGFGTDALKRLYQAYLARPGRPVDENHVILRNLRAAQLRALSDVARRFDRARNGDPDRSRAAKAALFSELFWDYLSREEGRVDTLTAADLREPTERDAGAMRAALVARAPADFNASLSARHGAGPAIEAFRLPAEAAMLAELRAEVHEDVPAAFEGLLTGGPDGTDGWFALFIRDAAKRLREDSKFERIWQGEQTAAIRVLSEQTGTGIADLRGIIDGHTARLKALGSQLDEIAGDAQTTHTLMADIADRLDDTRSWLYSTQHSSRMDGCASTRSTAPSRSRAVGLSWPICTRFSTMPTRSDGGSSPPRAGRERPVSRSNCVCARM